MLICPKCKTYGISSDLLYPVEEEERVLGSIIFHPVRYGLIKGKLEASDFSSSLNQQIFTVLFNLLRAETADDCYLLPAGITAPLIAREIHDQTDLDGFKLYPELNRLLELGKIFPCTIEEDAKTIKEKSVLRQFIKEGLSPESLEEIK